MIETVVIATDGSESAERAVDVALDLAARFDANAHALYVVDEGGEESPDEAREELADALEAAGDEALGFVEECAAQAGSGDVVTAVRRGEPATEIIEYATEQDADVIASGTRGRHGEHAFLLGSVAEAIVRDSPIPVLTVRQLDPDESVERPA